MRVYQKKKNPLWNNGFSLTKMQFYVAPVLSGWAWTKAILDNDVIEGAVNAIATADTLIIGGTSLNVYPAASLIHYFRGNTIVLINKSPTSADSLAQLVISEGIGQVLGQLKVR